MSLCEIFSCHRSLLAFYLFPWVNSQFLKLVCTYAIVSVVEAFISIVLKFILCHIQALDLLNMLKKEEEMLSAVKDRQSKVVQCLVCQILHEALLCVP